MEKYTIEIKWALILVVLLLLWTLLERLLGFHDRYLHKHPLFTLVFYLVTIVVYVFAMLDKRANFCDETITYANCFITGFIMTLIFTLFRPLSQWLISSIISPDFFKNMIEYTVDSRIYKNTAEAQAEFNFKNYATKSTISDFVIGLIITLIVGAFIQNN